MSKALIFQLVIFVMAAEISTAQNQPVAPFSKRYSFGNVTDGSLYKALLLLDKDSISRSVANACILGTTADELKENNFPDLENRIEKLVSSGVLKLTEGKYYLTIPVILGKKRELMYDLVWKKAMTLLPAAEPVLASLRKELGSRQDMAFHIFSTRIVDDLFVRLWYKQFPDEKSDPAEIWLIYPQHPFMVGSQYLEPEEKSQIAISWNNHCLNNLNTISGLKNNLSSLVLNKNLSQENSTALKKYGFSDETGNNRIFYYTKGDKLDRLFNDYAEQLVPSFASLYDYKSLSRTFDIPEKEIFLIVLHETAYSLYENMQHLNKLELPLALRNDTSSEKMVQLVSVKIRSIK